MIIDIVMPKMGESVTEGTILEWRKSVGDTIELDEILLEIGTDKVEDISPSSNQVDAYLPCLLDFWVLICFCDLWRTLVPSLTSFLTTDHLFIIPDIRSFLYFWL